MDEDMARLRSRYRRQRRNGHPPPSPSNGSFSSDSNNAILGLGTGRDVRDVLPLKSTYFEWCTEYFTEPQMRVGFLVTPRDGVFDRDFHSKRKRMSLGAFSIIIKSGGNGETNRWRRRFIHKQKSHVSQLFRVDIFRKLTSISTSSMGASCCNAAIDGIPNDYGIPLL